jgi:FkbM family methyltransferase
MVLTEVHGIQFYLDSKSTYTPRLVMTGLFDKGTTKLFRNLIKEGMVVLDIGANIGYYSLVSAQLAGESGKVFAFEPEPNNYTLLTKNIEANGFRNIVPVQKAVSNKTGKGVLSLSKETDLHSMHESNENGAIEVETTTVDDYIKNINCRIDLVKIDVEGWEMRVLEGMMETIRKNPDLKIITEFYPPSLKESGCSPEGFLQKLVDLGFKIYLTDEEAETTILTDVASLLKSPPNWAINLYCDRHG